MIFEDCTFSGVNISAGFLSEPSVPAPFDKWAAEGLVWLPELGMGRFPVTGRPYDAAYFRKYQEYAATPLGDRLNDLRLRLVEFYAGDQLLIDVGVGCGSFLEARGGESFGYDINPDAVTWLEKRELLRNPYRQEFPAATFWDSLEHIPDAHRIIANVSGWVFTSLPIFTDAEHVLRSKHFRRDEHCFYWTREGLIRWMAAQGFLCYEHNTAESLAGREDIHTFAFRRVE